MSPARYPVSTFWNAKKKRSELHFAGVVLYGTNDATMAVMGKIVEWETYIARVRRAYPAAATATREFEHVLYETEPHEPRDTKEKEGTP